MNTQTNAESVRNDIEKAREHFADKMAFSTGPVELYRQIKQKEKITIVDVREAEDYAAGHIPGAMNLPQSKWENSNGFDQNKVNVIYCYSLVCHLAAKAALLFAEKGFSVMEMDGGFRAWKEHDLPIEK